MCQVEDWEQVIDLDTEALLFQPLFLMQKSILTLSGQGDTRFCTTDLRFCVVTVTWRTPVRRVPVPCRITNLRCRTPLDLNRRILAAGKATDGGVLDVRRLTLTPPAVKRRWLRRVCPWPLRVIFLNSYFRHQFPILIDVLNMLRYSSNRNTIERRHHFLWQPYILVRSSILNIVLFMKLAAKRTCLYICKFFFNFLFS